MGKDVESLLTVKEVADKYQLTYWVIYQNIKTEPTFPAINLGPTKNYRIFEGRLKNWINRHPAKKRSNPSFVPSAQDIIEDLDL